MLSTGHTTTDFRQKALHRTVHTLQQHTRDTLHTLPERNRIFSAESTRAYYGFVEKNCAFPSTVGCVFFYTPALLRELYTPYRTRKRCTCQWTTLNLLIFQALPTNKTQPTAERVRFGEQTLRLLRFLSLRTRTRHFLTQTQQNLPWFASSVC